MKIESKLEDAGVFREFDERVYNARVYEIQDKDDNGNPLVTEKTEQGGGAPACILHFEVIGGDFNLRKIKNNWIMMGGKTKAGDPMPLGNYCAFLHYTGIPWECLDCGTRFNDKHSFLIATKADHERNPNLKIGTFYCKNCEHVPCNIAADTDDFVGATCGIRVQNDKVGDKTYPKAKAFVDLLDPHAVE